MNYFIIYVFLKSESFIPTNDMVTLMYVLSGTRKTKTYNKNNTHTNLSEQIYMHEL